MKFTLEPIRHTYYSKSKNSNVENREQILMRSGGHLGYPVSIFHIDLFWEDGCKNIHDRLSRGEIVIVNVEFMEQSYE